MRGEWIVSINSEGEKYYCTWSKRPRFVVYTQKQEYVVRCWPDLGAVRSGDLQPYPLAAGPFDTLDAAISAAALMEAQ